MDERNIILDEVQKNSAMSKRSSKGKFCRELQTNKLSSAYMWKLLKGIISEDMYCFKENKNLLPEEQKGLQEEK